MTCPTNNNLLEREGTKRVLANEIEDDISTFPAPVTGYITPLALNILFCLGYVISTKSS
jgi:hypothetical protein